MKLIFLIFLILLAACSSGPVKESSTDISDVTEDSFKKERALNKTEISDYYTPGVKSLNPALQDETLDRYGVDEIEKLAELNDPLIEMVIRCSKKDFNRAFAVASKNFNKYQKIPAYWNTMANCHLNQGSPRKALLFYNKALEVQPGYVPALNNIGVLYIRQGEDQKGLVAFERANKQSRFAKTPRYNLAQTYLRYGLVESAMPLFQGLLNESPSDVNLLNAVASSYFLMSNYSAAQSTYNRIPRNLWGHAEIGLNLAMTTHKLGNKEEARRIFSDIDEPKDRALKEYYQVIETQLGVK